MIAEARILLLSEMLKLAAVNEEALSNQWDTDELDKAFKRDLAGASHFDKAILKQGFEWGWDGDYLGMLIEPDNPYDSDSGYIWFWNLRVRELFEKAPRATTMAVIAAYKIMNQ